MVSYVGMQYCIQHNYMTSKNWRILSYRFSHSYEIFVANVLKRRQALKYVEWQMGMEKYSRHRRRRRRRRGTFCVRYGENAVRRVETM